MALAGDRLILGLPSAIFAALVAILVEIGPQEADATPAPGWPRSP